MHCIAHPSETQWHRSKLMCAIETMAQEHHIRSNTNRLSMQKQCKVQRKTENAKCGATDKMQSAVQNRKCTMLGIRECHGPTPRKTLLTLVGTPLAHRWHCVNDGWHCVNDGWHTVGTSANECQRSPQGLTHGTVCSVFCTSTYTHDT